jgi:hypothetical protein
MAGARAWALLNILFIASQLTAGLYPSDNPFFPVFLAM